MDAYVNLRYYFDGLYDVFDELASQRNVNAVGDLTRSFNRAANQSAEFVNSTITETNNKVADTIEEKLKVPVGMPPYRFEATVPLV